MVNILNFSLLLIGFSFSFLLYNRIAFGVILSIGLITLIYKYKEFLLNELKEIKYKIKKKDIVIFLLMILSFSFSSINSIREERSIPVLIYLIFFFLFSSILFLILRKHPDITKTLFRFLTLSICLNSLIIFFYNISNYNFSDQHELIRFKGYMNVLTVLVVTNFFLYKSKLNIISIFVLIPNIIMSNCNAAFLGLMIASCCCLIYFPIKKYFNKIHFFLSILISLTAFSILFAQKLPKDFDQKSINNFEFFIPTSFIDAHRQFIWGFSIEKFKFKPFFGYGQDTSNFIEGSQKEIGSKYTGNMNFIPSHPHNFLVELFLETGIVGTVFFVLLIFTVNQRIWEINSSNIFKFFLIIFNAYFWGASLVNFSFWLGWWQGSYYLILSFIASKAFLKKN
ncbi:MAG: O-antigen ligase family protein [Pseudomonadota bacterium]|nr:O-antigen ligase family protein [Pseudomonadota bacterium]